MPVTFTELAGSPRFSGSRDKLSAVREGYIDWSDINTLYSELFPAPVNTLKPSLPALLPGSTVLYAESVDFEPFIGDEDVPDCSGSIATYDYARVTINYATIPYEQSEDENAQIITKRYSSSGEFLTLPGWGLKFDGADKPLVDPDQLAGQIIPTTDISIRLHRVTPDFWAQLKGRIPDHIGTVNDDVFDGYPAEHVLFLGADRQQTISADGSRTSEVELRFSHRSVKDGANPCGWNFFFDPSTKTWKRLRIDRAVPNDIYPSTDFTQLFT